MSKFKLLAAALTAVVISGPVLAQDENAVDPQYTWDLGDIFPSVEAWDAARQEVLDSLEEIEQRRGTLGKSAADLYETLELVSNTQRKAGNVFVYAALNNDEDQRVTETQERRQLGSIMYSRFGESVAWMQPEIIEVGREVIESYINEDERLKVCLLYTSDAADD